MILEHSQDRALIEEIETQVRVSKIFEFTRCANNLSSRLRNHIYKEDQILFASVDELLSPEQDVTLLDELQRFETPFDREILDKKLTELRSLEWKYLRR